MFDYYRHNKIIVKNIDKLLEFPGIWAEFELDDRTGLVDPNGVFYCVTRALDIVDMKDGKFLTKDELQEYRNESKENPYKYQWRLEFGI